MIRTLFGYENCILFNQHNSDTLFAIYIFVLQKVGYSISKNVQTSQFEHL